MIFSALCPHTGSPAANDHLKKQMKSSKLDEVLQGDSSEEPAGEAKESAVRSSSHDTVDDGKLKKVLAKVKTDLQWCISELQK